MANTLALRKFLYLDTDGLDDYLDALEDGRRQRTEDTTRRGRRVSGKVGYAALGAEAARVSEGDSRSERVDTPAARFQRLIELALAGGEDGLWAELQDLSQLADVGVGTLVHVECEVFIPDAVKLLAGDELSGMLSMMSDLAPHAAALGLDLEGMPSSEQLAAMQQFTLRVKNDLVLVGEGEQENWSIAGKLDKRYVRDAEIDGFVRVVGKVTQRWPENQWKPLLALPGAALVGRKQRLALERKQPKHDEVDQYLQGPAVMLDLLAVYR